MAGFKPCVTLIPQHSKFPLVVLGQQVAKFALVTSLVTLPSERAGSGHLKSLLMIATGQLLIQGHFHTVCGFIQGFFGGVLVCCFFYQE